MLDSHRLEEQAKKLLAALVEAERNVPSDRRQQFLMNANMSTGNMADLMHPGLPAGRTQVYPGDIRQLAAESLVFHDEMGRGSGRVEVTPEGFEYYRVLKAGLGEPIQRTAAAAHELLTGAVFQRQFPKAYALWALAEGLLWSADRQQQLTAIGHHCREAMQAFVSEMLADLKVSSADPDAARTISRLRTCIQAREELLPSTVKPVLDALIVYWGTVSDLAQRQEHGAVREGTQLVWEDARRLVFLTCYVMHECSAALSIGADRVKDGGSAS